MNMNKSLWERYGRHLIVFTVVFSVGYAAVQVYGHYQAKRVIEASTLYETMLASVRQKDWNKAKPIAKKIVHDYKSTPYAALAALTSARMAVEENNYPDAISYLNLALELGKKPPVQQVAKVRLAKVLTAQKKYDEALALLQAEKAPDGYVTLYEEAKGDIYAAQNDKDKAREAYETALKVAPQGAPITRIQLKLNDVNTNVKEAS